MAKAKITIPEDILNNYDKLIAMVPEIVRRGATCPYTSLNGNMFTSLTKDGRLGIRLSKEDMNEFIENYNAILFVSYGATMKGYVEVPNDLLERTEELLPYLEKSFEHAKTLKAKATTKKKK